MQTCNIILLWLTCRLLIYSQQSKPKIKCIKYNVLYVHVPLFLPCSLVGVWYYQWQSCKALQPLHHFLSVRKAQCKKNSFGDLSKVYTAHKCT